MHDCIRDPIDRHKVLGIGIFQPQVISKPCPGLRVETHRRNELSSDFERCIEAMKAGGVAVLRTADDDTWAEDRFGADPVASIEHGFGSDLTALVVVSAGRMLRQWRFLRCCTIICRSFHLSA